MTDQPFNANEKYFAHEKLVAYDLAMQAVHFVAKRTGKLRGLPGEAGPQLARAVAGAQTNLCSGAAHEGAEAKRHFRIALSEASEAGGANDLAFAFAAFSREEHQALRAILLRLAATLRGLARR
jgi:hypothetical protein